MSYCCFPFIFVATREKSCACLVSHTYKQIRKLWELPKDKQQAAVAAAAAYGSCALHNGGSHKFDDDIDRSTSSSTGLYTSTQLS